MRTKRILSIVLTLAMLLGMFPGMSLTASAADSTTEITPSNTSGAMTITLTIAAAQAEELLTTITATGKEQASYSTANVASVSFSYTAYGSSAYLANWGWWGYGWTATVAPANGYTITKCVFYDDANRKATDSEAPFVVETTEADKTPRINGTPIDGGNNQSKGLKKIEVYGYATPASSYSVTITAGDHMTKTADSGDAEQTGLTGAMTDVVYTADNGYYYPTDYSVAEVSGIKVTRDSYTQITVSGTPTADAAIALTAPTAKTTPDAPTTAAAENCTTADNNDGTLTGVTTAMEYKKSDADSWTAGTGSDITGLVPGTYYVRVKATDTTNESANQELTIKGFISYTVTFKVVNGKWNEGEGDAATADKTVTLTGHDGDTLKLTADQIPAVGTKPNDTYKAGSWDVMPSADTEITAATTYTYTYAQKDSISQTVTFKVVNGSWNDETTTDKTVTLTGYEGDTLKLAADQIPTVGTKPNDTYKAGSWDVTPSTETEITAATTYTYTYVAKEASVVTKAPEAKTLTYNGQAQELVTAGTATGGEMQYALGNATEATQPYTTSIPTATDAGTYYVWYKVKGDDNHVDSAVCAAPVTVTIALANKDALNTAITEAETYYNTIKDNADYTDIAATLKSAIDAAKEVANNDNATAEQVSEAVNSATNAKKTAEDAVKAADEKKAADVTAAKAVTDAINALPESAGVNDKAKVEAARKAYDALTEEQKKLVSGDELKKLTDAEASVQAAEEAAKKAAEEAAKKAADEAAAKAVTDAINALPESAGTGDKAAVEAARAAYDALTEDQKKLIPEDALAKLTAAEQQVREAEEAAKTIDIAKCKITVKNQTYTGKALKPAVTVKRGKVTLKKGTDYTVTYKNNVKIGLATATVKGKGKYVGTRKVTFKINPKGTAFTKLTGGNRRIALKWKNPKKITGYRIQYSRKKDFSIRTTVTIEKAKTLTATFKRLAANKTYYVRIRTYTTVNGKNYYSAWSKAVTVKTKSANAGNGPDGQDAEAAVADEETLPLDEVTLPLDEVTLPLDEELDGALPPEEVIVLPEEILEDDILLNLAE